MIVTTTAKSTKISPNSLRRKSPRNAPSLQILGQIVPPGKQAKSHHSAQSTNIKCIKKISKNTKYNFVFLQIYCREVM